MQNVLNENGNTSATERLFDRDWIRSYPEYKSNIRYKEYQDNAQCLSEKDVCVLWVLNVFLVKIDHLCFLTKTSCELFMLSLSSIHFLE